MQVSGTVCAPLPPAGSMDSVLRALRARGERRLLVVFEALCSGNNFKDCAVHWYGNFTVQDMFDAAAKLRIVAQGPHEVGAAAAAGAARVCMHACNMLGSWSPPASIAARCGASTDTEVSSYNRHASFFPHHCCDHIPCHHLHVTRAFHMRSTCATTHAQHILSTCAAHSLMHKLRPAGVPRPLQGLPRRAGPPWPHGG
jgi:hypothetical protein